MTKETSRSPVIPALGRIRVDSHFKCNTTFQKDLCRSPVAQALARGIVVGLNHLRKPHWSRPSRHRLAQSSPQPAYGVLHPSLLPGGVGIAEEPSSPSQYGVQTRSRCGRSPSGDSGAPATSHRRWAWMPCRERYEDAGIAPWSAPQSIGTEQHQVRLPVPGSAAVSSTLMTLGNRAPHSHEGGRTAPFAASPAPLRLAPR